MHLNGISDRRAAALLAALAAIGLLVTMALPSAADSAAGAKRVMPVLTASADLGVPAPDRTLEKDYGIVRPFRPKVYFKLKRAVPGATYHLDLKRSKPYDFSKAKPGVVPCGVQTLSTVVSKPVRANGFGEVAFPRLPVGGYLDIRELCPGYYVGVITERLPGSRSHRSLLTVGFFYPDLEVVQRWWTP